jgi:ethanolamine utilization protein EutN
MSDELKATLLLITHHSSLITFLMIIARILGTVVSTQKDERLRGSKLLLVRPLNLDGTDASGYVVAVDTVGAGFHERVLVVAGSSARLAEGQKDRPVDAAIVGVVDRVDFLND